MADDWEDDDFAVPVLNAGKAVNKFDDEEDEALVEEEVVASGPSEAQIALAKKKAAEEETKLANKLKFALTENETDSERRARVRKEQEEGETEMAAEMFGLNVAKKDKGPSVAAGVAGVNLKNKQDHVNFAITCSNKLLDSTGFCLAAYYKTLSERCAGNLSLESLEEIIGMLDVIRVAKKKAEEARPTENKKKSKKDSKKEQKKHAEIFGGDFVEDQYGEAYGGLEDDYMF